MGRIIIADYRHSVHNDSGFRLLLLAIAICTLVAYLTVQQYNTNPSQKSMSIHFTPPIAGFYCTPVAELHCTCVRARTYWSKQPSTCYSSSTVESLLLTG